MTPYNSRIRCFVGYFPHSQNQLYNSPLQICIVGRMYFAKKKTQNDMSNWNKKPDDEKNLSLNRVFSQVGQYQVKNAHGRTCKGTKVYIYLYISLYENLFENGCIYIYLAEFLKTYLKMDQNIRTESWR